MKKTLFLFIAFWWIIGYAQAKIVEVKLNTSLEVSTQQGDIQLQVKVAEQKYKGATLTYLLKNPEGKIIAQQAMPISKRHREVSFKPITLQKPMTWNDETPTMYTMEIKLLQKDGTLLDHTQRPVIFRHIQLLENELIVNGKSIRIKGINLRCLKELADKNLLTQNIKLWKKHHINAIRIQAIPKNSPIHELCNQYGIYVLNEEAGYPPTHPALREGCLWEWPNQDLMVKMEEMKKLYQNIRFFDFDREKGTISIQNLHSFTSLNQFDFYYLIRDHGQEVYRASLENIEAQPGETIVYKGLKGYDLNRNTTGDVRIEFYATYRYATPFAPKGSLAAREQTYIHTFFRPAKPAISQRTLLDKMTESAQTITFEGKDLKLVFNKNSGLLTSYQHLGEEYIHQEQGLHPFFWRAPTYNDRIAQLPQVLNAWKEASYQPIKATSFQCIPGQDEMATLTATYHFPQTNAQWHITYKIYADGTMKVDNQFTAEEQQTPMIPRVGLRMQLNPAFTFVHYFGRGPYTNYRDCRTAQFLGEYSSSIQATQDPCQRLQENGHRTDIYWCALLGHLQGGLLFVADRTFEMNLSQQLLEDVEQNLRRSSKLVDFFVDYRMMGIGADNRPGTPVQEPYLIRPGKDNTIQYGFTMVPFSKEEDFKKFILKY